MLKKFFKLTAFKHNRNKHIAIHEFFKKLNKLYFKNEIKK